MYRDFSLRFCEDVRALLGEYHTKGQNFDFHHGNRDLVVYFSSNGLYFPDTSEEIRTRIVDEDRYEWSAFHQTYFPEKSALFLRDLYKSWYVFGVNAQLSSQEAVLSFVEKISESYQNTVTVGNSAGGYMALRQAIRLNCPAITIGAQLSFSHLAHNEKYMGLERMVGVDVGLIPNSSKLYYSALCLDDLKQFRRLIPSSKLRLLLSVRHGKTPKLRIRDDIAKTPF